MYILIPFITFMIMTILGQEKGNEAYLIYSIVPMILMFVGIICQTDVAKRKKEVRIIFGK